MQMVSLHAYHLNCPQAHEDVGSERQSSECPMSAVAYQLVSGWEGDNAGCYA